MLFNKALALGVILSASLTSARHVEAKEKELPPAQPPTAVGQLSPDNTVRLVVLDRLKSGTSKKGDRINLRVDEDVADPAGTILIRKGTPAYGTVTQSRGSGLFGKRGLLDIAVEYTTSVDGQKVPLRATKSRGGKSNTGVSVAAVVLLAPVALIIKGSNVTVDPGTPLIAFVDDTVKVGRLMSDDGAAKPATDGPEKVLILRNGDKITGRLESLSDGVYTVATANGTLKIKEADVKEIADSEQGSTGKK